MGRVHTGMVAAVACLRQALYSAVMAPHCVWCYVRLWRVLRLRRYLLRIAESETPDEFFSHREFRFMGIANPCRYSDGLQILQNSYGLNIRHGWLIYIYSTRTNRT